MKGKEIPRLRAADPTSPGSSQLGSSGDHNRWNHDIDAGVAVNIVLLDFREGQSRKAGRCHHRVSSFWQNEWLLPAWHFVGTQ